MAASLLILDIAESAVCVQGCQPRRYLSALLGCFEKKVPWRSWPGWPLQIKRRQDCLWARLALPRVFIAPCTLAESSFLIVKYLHHKMPVTHMAQDGLGQSPRALKDWRGVNREAWLWSIIFYLICRQIQKLPVFCFQLHKYACHSSYLPSFFPFLLGYAIDHIPHQSLVPKGFATGKISVVSMLPPRRHEFPWPQYSQSVVCCWNELPAKGQQEGVCDGKCTEDMGDHGRVQSLLGCWGGLRGDQI